MAKSTGEQPEIGDRVRIADDWYGVGQKGTVIGNEVFIEQWWCPILWDGEDDPEFHKSAGLVRLHDHEAKSLGEEIINGLREGLEDLRAGRLHDHEDMKRELG